MTAEKQRVSNDGSTSSTLVVTLIGYRGSGKTAVAPKLAAQLGCEWRDSDVEVESTAGRTIKDIFASDGEAEFRRLEREAIQRLLQNPPLVLAAGGGAVLNADTRRDIREAGPVVWLRAGVETLLQRIENDPTTSRTRPNLTAAGGRSEIEKLLAVREPLYRECAWVTVDTDDLNVEQAVSAIGRLFNPLPNKGA